MQRVREVVRGPRPRAVGPGAPHLLGVVALRGEVVPVFDLAGRLGVAPVAAADPPLLVVSGERMTYAVPADAVGGVVAVPADAVEPAPYAGATVAGVVARGDGLLVVLAEDELAAGFYGSH